MVPEILERLEKLEKQKLAPVKDDTEELDALEQELQQRFHKNVEMKQQLEQLASKLMEEMKLIEKIQPGQQEDVSKQIAEQEETIANMEKLFKTATDFFAQMYSQIQPKLNIPDLQDQGKPTSILSGLEQIVKGIGNMVQQLQAQ